MDEELNDDWSAFNEMLSSIELLLPEVDFTNISIRQIVCRYLAVSGSLNGLDDANGGTGYILSTFADALFAMSICTYRRNGIFVIQRR